MRTVVAAGVLFLLVVLTAGSWKTETRRVPLPWRCHGGALRVKAWTQQSARGLGTTKSIICTSSRRSSARVLARTR